MTSNKLPVLNKGERIGGQERATLRARMVAAYTAGAPIRSIAEQVGRSYGFVHRVLCESDVALRSRGGKHHLDSH